jgi:cytochrome c biogenesis protein CcmG, thiol:disulfide interchange protein DsbE
MRVCSSSSGTMKKDFHPRNLLIRTTFLLAATLLLSLGFAGTLVAQLPVIRFVRDPDPAPDFKLKDLDGKELSLSSLSGKVVLLNFWATWCGPCRAEIPSLIQLQSRYKDRMQIIGLVVDDDDQTAIRKFAEDEGINYPIALASDDVRLAYGGVSALPTVFLLNTSGRVVQKHVGLFNPALYETEVRSLLNMPVAAQVETFEDTGEVFLKHADRATNLPGVELGKLSPEQRKAALHKFNAEDCNCGCKFTLAQCRIYDPACQISQKRTEDIVKEVAKLGDEKEKQLPSNDSPPAEIAKPQP